MNAPARRFSTLATFRNANEFPLDVALKQYHSDPIPYANALADIGKELCEITYQRDASDYCTLLAKGRLLRQRYYYMVDGSDGIFTFMSLRELFMPWQAIRLFDRRNRFFRDHATSFGAKILRLVGFAGQREAAMAPSTVKWVDEFKMFRQNVNSLCRAVSSETDDFPTPQETIQRLKRYASEGKQRISPFYSENALLRKTIEGNKRVITALRVRHAIEKLVGELPINTYPDRHSGPRWTRFWRNMWADAQDNAHNPFHELRTRATGPYDLRNIERRGEQLFADMSTEIHHCAGMDLEYEHFDYWTREITNVLVPDDDMRTGDVNWRQEIRRYPVPGLPKDGAVVMADDDGVIKGDFGDGRREGDRLR
jgi:hypothetical protein